MDPKDAEIRRLEHQIRGHKGENGRLQKELAAVTAERNLYAGALAGRVPDVLMLMRQEDGWARLERIRDGKFDSTAVFWDQAEYMLAERERLLAEVEELRNRKCVHEVLKEWSESASGPLDSREGAG